MLCQICGKPRTNTAHADQGEIPPDDEPEQGMSEEQEQQLIAEQIRRTREAKAAHTQPQHMPEETAEPMPADYLSIRTTPAGIEVIMLIPSDIPMDQVLNAVVAFQGAVQPVVADAPPEPKKKR